MPDIPSPEALGLAALVAGVALLAAACALIALRVIWRRRRTVPIHVHRVAGPRSLPAGALRATVSYFDPIGIAADRMTWPWRKRPPAPARVTGLRCARCEVPLSATDAEFAVETKDGPVHAGCA